jgi:hypothetical protein
MHDLISGIGLMRAPLIVAGLAVLAILVPSQSHEVFVAIAEASGAALAFELGRAIAGLGVLCLVIVCCSILLIANCPSAREGARDRHRAILEATALSLPAPLITAFVLAFADDASIERARALFGLPYSGRASYLVLTALVAMAICTGLLMLASSLREALFRAILCAAGPSKRLPVWAGLSITAAVLAGVIGLVVVQPKQIAAGVGPFAVLTAFFAITAVAGSLLTYIYDRHQLPVLTICLIAALVWAGLGINNNHGIRLVVSQSPAPVATVAFAEWLGSRPDLSDFAGRHYPVYIVAAEGGGIYAAKHAAFTLAWLQDSCPAFAQHVFAISGVSGGSLGAAVFSALVGAHEGGNPPVSARPSSCVSAPEANSAYRSAVRSFFREDLLTPLLAAGLFPDFLQRILPVPIGEFDRARALEMSLEQAWPRTVGQDSAAATFTPFAEDHRKLWRPGSNSPALLLNATTIQSGDRVVISPFRLRDRDTTFADQFVDLLNRDSTVRLSTAVGLSARFPLITPPALLFDPDGRAVQLVDGGYFDNSGIRTAAELIDKLRHATASPAPASTARVNAGCASGNESAIRLGSGAVIDVCFKIIVIRGSKLSEMMPVLGELLSPMLALNQTRIAAGRANMRDVHHAYCGGRLCGVGRFSVDPHIYVKTLDVEELPLGWYLSTRSLNRIATQAAPQISCDKIISGAAGTSEEPVSLEHINTEESACIVERISRDLDRRQ